jgi:hypothetical protein
MIWFFERQQSRLNYEIRRQTDADAYELVITHPDGHQDLERFVDPVVLNERSQSLQATLLAAGWEPPRRRVRSVLKAVS